MNDRRREVHQQIERDNSLWFPGLCLLGEKHFGRIMMSFQTIMGARTGFHVPATKLNKQPTQKLPIEQWLRW
jgi:hypothetical protein